MHDERSIDMLAVAGVDADLVLKVDYLPTDDDKVMGSMVGWMAGGPTANSACAASRLGLRVNALAVIGDDRTGKIILDSYAEFGVDTALVELDPNVTSPFTVILIPPNGEKAIVVVPGSRPVYDMERVEQALRQTRVMYMLPGARAQFLQFARLAHTCGAEVMIDVESTSGITPSSLGEVLATVDIASFNKDGFVAATGEQPTAESLRSLLGFGPHTIVVTLGARGSLAATAEQFVQLPGHRVEAVDTTGAGDTFNAAFLYATLADLGLEERLRFANAAAALSVTGMGPRGRLPTRAEVAEFLKTSIEE
jgi:sugar/nucleoside kinase (ribokinase family)